jgi:hypothetical protein
MAVIAEVVWVSVVTGDWAAYSGLWLFRWLAASVLSPAVLSSPADWLSAAYRSAEDLPVAGQSAQ